MPAFPFVEAEVDFAALEHTVLALWQRTDAFARSVTQRPESAAYVFYDGPPFATGLPHYGHLVASTLKDIVPRYWAMRGMRVERRFGWDTHGLPIENQMERELGLSGPTSVREFGVDKFNEACRANVLKYTAEWEKVVTRLGRWVDFENDYKTMDAAFMESVWWVFKQLWDKGLVYKDRRVMPFSWKLSTSLSNFEANSDYRDVQDPALTVRLPIIGDADDAALLIWTTTPWTLPSNLGVAVGPEIDYVRARRKADGHVYIVAAERSKTVLGEDAEVLATMKGAELVGVKYTPLFPYFTDTENAFQVIPSGHVTTGDGTGLVHMAPAYGEDDFAACKKAGIPVVDPVDEEGRFTAAVADYVGQNVKEADKHIIHDLKARGSVFKHDTIQHSYPFCWRSGTPLIYKTVPAWFVKVEALRDRMVAHNEAIHWVPEAVGAKRFGNWLAEARDWNISRKRFWGTPIPVWSCPDCGVDTAVGSIAELEAASGAGEPVTDIHPHRIDHLHVKCSGCGGANAKRIPDVFDCWFESGAMPYAQDHYPFDAARAAQWGDRFPAQFIAEGLDQTRGWFYTLLVLSTALFDAPPFKNCIVNGLVLAEDGSKMSKSKRNYPDPALILESYGADALRAYLISSPVVRAEPLRFSETGVREVVRTVLLPLRNAWSFLVQYANIDGWHPGTGMGEQATPAVAERPELDRWLLSVLQSLVREVNEQMEGYYLYKVVPPMLGFIDHLTNWYIRRSRRRFWRSATTAEARRDKASAYATLYETLVTFSKLTAPVLPFMSEALYQNLVVAPGVVEGERDSVHLCDYPTVDAALIDADLEREVALTREAVGLGRALREKHKLKTRQPLARVTIVHHETSALAALERHRELIADELNVREVALVRDDADLASLTFKANFKTLGPKLGQRMKEAAAFIGALSREQFALLQDGGALEVAGANVTLADVLVTRTARGDVVIETAGALTVALETTLDEKLIAEGHAREVVSRVQKIRKDTGLAVTDRIALQIWCTDDALSAALDAHRVYVADEVLAVRIDLSTGEPVSGAVVLEGLPVTVFVEKFQG
jgi:isoleucyl-tRNA synthetase